jgi:hypothetical protein
MSRIARGKQITFTFKDKGPGGKATLVIDVSAEDDILPHEHRDDMREIAAAMLAVPVAALEGVEVELKRTGGDHEHPPHPHPAPISLPSDQSGGEKTKA